MDPTPAITTLAPAPSTAVKAITRSALLEAHVGAVVAAAAGAIAAALGEFQEGALTTSTKMAGGNAIFQLFRLRQYMIGRWDFDTIARTHGRAVLRECCGSDITDATVDALVDETLAILAKVVRSQLN